MTQKKKAAPKCGPSLSGSKTTKHTQHNTHQSKSTSGMMVAWYRVTEAGTADYFDLFAPLRSTVDAAIELVKAGFPLGPEINKKCIKQLSDKLHKACDSMALGLVADVQILIHSNAGTSLFGVHRKPTAGDRVTKSILVIGVNRHGQSSQIRLQPSLSAIERMAAAFGMEVPHVH